MAAINPNFDTREAWLTEAASILMDGVILPAAGMDAPPAFRITTGFPKHTRGRRVIAQCFVREASTDGVNEVFVSPELDNPMDILPTLVHELIHAADNCASGHRGFFARVAQAVGLEGPMTATVAGPALQAQLQALCNALGAYPHSRMDIDKFHVKQTVRQLKVSCNRCGFLARSSASQLRNWARADECCPCCRNPLTFPAAIWAQD